MEITDELIIVALAFFCGIASAWMCLEKWQEQNGLTMEEALAAIRAAKAEDAPTIRRTEKQLDALRAKGGRTAQARARARKAAQ